MENSLPIIDSNIEIKGIFIVANNACSLTILVVSTTFVPVVLGFLHLTILAAYK